MQNRFKKVSMNSLVALNQSKQIKSLADWSNLTKSPDGERYFGFIKNSNAYIEVMSYKSLITHAKMRNAIFFEKLGINNC